VELISKHGGGRSNLPPRKWSVLEQAERARPIYDT